MTLTAHAAEEMVRARFDRAAATAELATIIRLRGEFTAGKTLTIPVDSQPLSARIVALYAELFTAPITADGTTIVIKQGLSSLIRTLGLVTRGGQPVRGLPTFIVSGTLVEAEAAWRGAFLARGTLTEPGRASSLDIECPSEEVALALVGCARRLNISAKSKEVRGAQRALIKDDTDIGSLLTRLGAQRTRLEWEEQRRQRENRNSGGRLVNFDDANLRRSAQAAMKSAARVERALEILGDDVPDHLAEAGRLRLLHRRASLEELGKLADTPMTKDAIAGRIRRLLTTADRRAEELGIAPTSEAVPDDADAELGTHPPNGHETDPPNGQSSCT
ncbi:MAG: DNA-binding protein WhiA [Corynebacterium sp.]|nr:DNA-binding protein WhiA [Corynebacterium sp.]